MNKNLSVYIDLLRLLAALVVVVGHIGEVFGTPMPDLLAHSAKEGVAIFFVLSGFVISFVTENKERQWQQYARARAVRMYSVVPLAILVIIGVDAVGEWLNPDFYDLHRIGVGTAHTFIGGQPTGAAILRYLTFTNEFWFDHVVIGSGAPYWSLGFEVPYYVAFGFWFFGPRGWRWLLVAAWLILCGPKIALGLPLWIMGAATFHLVRRGYRLPQLQGSILLVLLIAGAVIVRRSFGSLGVPMFEWHHASVTLMSLAYYATIAGSVCASILLFAGTFSGDRLWPRNIVGSIRFLAGASFTFYIMHLPFLTLFAAVFPDSHNSIAGGVIVFCAVLPIMLLLAEFGERRKSFYDGIVDRTMAFLHALQGRAGRMPR